MRRHSVAVESLAERRERVARLTIDERVALALALGRRDLEIYATAKGLDVPTARRAVQRRRQLRRRTSGCMDAMVR
jgi:hypothetical protein